MQKITETPAPNNKGWVITGCEHSGTEYIGNPIEVLVREHQGQKWHCPLCGTVPFSDEKIK